MCRILIFGGTSEGRELALFCGENKIPAYVSVATDYGAELLGEIPFVKVLSGRMTDEAMSDFISSQTITTIVDATHPYAEEVSKNIIRACEKIGARRVRVLRGGDNDGRGHCFESIGAIVDYLNSVDGNILITTGSKELGEFKRLNGFCERCAVRVLPTKEAINVCLSLGLDRSRIIAEMGPFSEKENLEHLMRFRAKYLITKDSGSAGGFASKLSAAEKYGAQSLVLRRPKEKGVSLDEAKKILLTVKNDE